MNPAQLQKIKKSFIKTTMQNRAGLVCLASIINYYGGKASMDDLSRTSGVAETGVTLLGLCKTARLNGFNAEGFKANVEALKTVENPLILHILKDSGLEDFVVFYGWDNEKFIIGDPTRGIIEYREDELEAAWSSKSLIVVEPGENFKSVNKKQIEKRNWLVKKLSERGKVIFWITALGMFNFIILMYVLFFINEKLNVAPSFFDNKQFWHETIVIVFLIVLSVGIAYTKSVFSKLEAKRFSLKLTKVITTNASQSASILEIIDSLHKSAQRLSKSIYFIIAETPITILVLLVALVFIIKSSLASSSVVLLLSLFWVLFFRKNKRKIKAFKNELKESEIQNYKAQKRFSYDFKKIKLTNSEKHIQTQLYNKIKPLSEHDYQVNGFEKQLLYLSLIEFVVAVFLQLLITGIFKAKVTLLSINTLLLWNITFFTAGYHLKKIGYKLIELKADYNFLYNHIGASETYSGKKEDIPVVEQLQVNNVEISNLGFGFPGKYALFRDLNITAKRGELTAVFGGSGIGKTVLFSVLNRLLLPVDGSIKLDDKSWETFDTASWRMMVSSVIQPAKLFDTTVVKNIGWGENYNPNKVVSFCKELGFDKYFELFPKGYKTNSSELSAGEKQLVALAAALYRNPKILLLDEPFFAMDENREEYCLKLLNSVKNKMIIIVFTGRTTLKSGMDKVFCL